MLYDTLDKTRRLIRLLEIAPSNSLESPLDCTLATVFLGDRPEYTALSYVWGDAADTVDITVNAETLAVTRNLDSALHHIRDVQTECPEAMAERQAVNTNLG
jgi:Heterokaryon incompatibility protein (HET)